MALFVPKDRKSLFRQFLAGMYDAVVITDASGHVLEVNARAEEFFSRTAESMIDLHISVLVRGLTAEIVRRIRRGLDDDRHVVIDGTGMRKDGACFSCEVAISRLELTEPDDLVFIVRNVERRRQLRAMLRTKENAFDVAQSALFACDADGRFTHVNQSFLDLFGMADAETVCEKSFSELMDDAPLGRAFSRALAGSRKTVEIMAECDDDGESRKMSVTLAPDRQGRKIVGVVGSVIRV